MTTIEKIEAHIRENYVVDGEKPLLDIPYDNQDGCHSCGWKPSRHELSFEKTDKVGELWAECVSKDAEDPSSHRGHYLYVEELHLEHFLAALKRMKKYITSNESSLWIDLPELGSIKFNLKTGQPATPDDWEKLSELLEIE